MVTNMEFLNKIEQQMLANLSSDLRLMNDLNATKKLADLKKQFDETEERWDVWNFINPAYVLGEMIYLVHLTFGMHC